ncbi:MAG: AAA family ATPase [bacterium]|nr:AAA family ATPase [bacterium]
MPVTIEDIYRQFNPLEPLEVGDDRYVDCTEVRGIPSLFERLKLALANGTASILFAGLMGDGKTTLLKRLRKHLEEAGHLVAFGEASRRLNINDVDSEDVIVLILGAVGETLRERYGQSIEDGPLRRHFEDLQRILSLDLEVQKIDVGLNGVLKATLEAKDVALVRKQLRDKLRAARGPNFLELANAYLDRAREIVAEADRNKRLVVILDDLNRIESHEESDILQQCRLFLSQHSDLIHLRCHAIYTLSLGLALKERLNLGARYGQEPIVVPMVPTHHRDGSRHEAGMAKLREIIRRRVKKAGSSMERAFGDPQIVVDRICEASGGNLRDLFTLVRGVCAETLADRVQLPLTEQAARAAVNLFYAGKLDTARRYWKDLEQVHETHTFTDLEPEIQLQLLKNRLVYVYYDDTYWYDVCSAVRNELIKG